PFPDFLDARLFKPLSLKDTTFYPTPSQTRRIARSYAPGEGERGLVETDIFFLKGPLTSHERTPFPAGGLFSTASDLARFYQMVLNGGFSGGRKYLSKPDVEQMTLLP